MKETIPLLYDCVLPNGPLPNAMITEFGVLNYMHSLHADQRHFNLLEQEYGHNDSTLAGSIFNNNLGQFPNSLSGSHLKSPCYTQYFEIKESSLFFGCNDRFKYVYPIKMTPHFDRFVGRMHMGSKINGEYFWKYISSIALNHVRTGRALIMIDYAQENFIDKGLYEMMHECLKYSGIPKEQIVLGFNSFNAQEVYENWFPENERMLTVKNWPFVLTNTSHHYTQNPSQRMSYTEFIESENTIRKYKFLFKVRRPRTHRLAFLARLITDGLIDQGDWSCLSPVNATDDELNWMMRDFDITFDIDKVKEALKNVPKNLESESGTHYTEVRAWTDTHPNAYRNSYFYVCTETFTHEPHKSLTEKVFKPIVNFQPFLFVAYPGALQLLRELGFKTFSPYIDESYDDEKDRNTRMKMIYDEVTRLTNMSVEELHKWYWGMKDILIHNNQHLLNYWKNNPRCIDFIKYINERIKE